MWLGNDVSDVTSTSWTLTRGIIFNKYSWSQVSQSSTSVAPGLRFRAALRRQSLISMSDEQTSGNALANNNAAWSCSIASWMTAWMIGRWLRTKSLVDLTVYTSPVLSGQPAWGISKSGVFSWVATTPIHVSHYIKRTRRCCSPESSSVGTVGPGPVCTSEQGVEIMPVPVSPEGSSRDTLPDFLGSEEPVNTNDAL